MQGDRKRRVTSQVSTPKAIAIIAALVFACSNLPLLIAELIVSNAWLTWVVFSIAALGFLFILYIGFSISRT